MVKVAQHMLPLYDPHYTYAYGGVLVFDRGAVLVYLLSEYLEEIVIIKMYMRGAHCLAVLGKFTVPCDQNHAVLFCIITRGGITLDICYLIHAVLLRCTHRVPNTVVCRTICQASGLRLFVVVLGLSWILLYRAVNLAHNYNVCRIPICVDCVTL